MLALKLLFQLILGAAILATTLTDQVILSVVGMVCMSCVNNIETNIGKMAGVKSVNVSLDHNTATVQYYPSTITPVKLCEAIKDLGFETSPSNRTAAFI